VAPACTDTLARAPPARPRWEPEVLGDAPRELYVERSVDRAPLGRRHLDARSATNRLTRYRLPWPSVMPFEVEPGARNLLRWTRRFSCREGRR
jgi:hypothetical protein